MLGYKPDYTKDFVAFYRYIGNLNMEGWSSDEKRKS